MSRTDTIAAIATAPGPAGVAVVRVSGPEAFDVAERLAGGRPEAGRIAFAGFRPPGAAGGPPPPLLDSGLLLAFKGPHSYTGEDVVEFQCHGGRVTPRRILEACLSAGARLARRGEFTERAFLNGKLDYDQAESVLDLVQAKTGRAADAALAGLGGRRKQALRAVYGGLLELSSTVEHALDVSEDELPPGFLDAVARARDGLVSGIAGEIGRLAAGKILREGALVALAGPPNAGKSSLMNALLGEERAIVSDVPGTTRDAIEESLDVEGWPVRLADTAGLRETSDAVEREGVARAEALVASADLVLALDCDRPGANVIRVHAKCDLGPGEGLPVSSKTGEGLEDLRRAIAAALEARAASVPEAAPEGDRVVASLLAALASLKGPVGDLVVLANRVRTAAETVGSALGAAYSQDLLDALFSRFCVGK